MRTLLKTYAAAMLLTGALSAIEGGRRLLLGVALGHRYTVAQYTLFGILVAGGVLGCVSGLLLLRLRRAGLWTAAPYSALVLAYFALADLGFMGIFGLVAAGAGIVTVATPPARRLCSGRSFAKVAESM